MHTLKRNESDGGMTQVVECLPTSKRPLVQTPVPPKNKEMKTYTHTKTCPQIFIAALSIIAEEIM
jgi:hypothetical protein